MSFPTLLATADGAILQVLGGTVRYSPDGVEGSFVDVPGIFEAQHRRADVLDVSVSASVPAVFVRLAGLASDPDTDADPTLEVSGTRYRVREVQKDGQGGVLLLLKETE